MLAKCFHANKGHLAILIAAIYPFLFMAINRFLGGVLLVAGTTIGAGMLALPVMTSFVGLIPSAVIFGVCWLFMLLSALYLLDVSLSMRGEVNLISMSRSTLGALGQIVSWSAYLLLLYLLTAAYIAAGAPLFQMAIFSLTHYRVPLYLAYFVLPLFSGVFIYFGLSFVDIVNRFLMLGLLVSFLMLIGSLPKEVESSFLFRTDWAPTFVALPVVITSFGYHIIIPSLKMYMHQNKKQLRWVLITGSLLALIVYVTWEIITLGAIPLEGEFGFANAWNKGLSVTYLLAHISQNQWVKTGAHFFSFFAIVTSFLGVSLSLSDFLKDGFRLKNTWASQLLGSLLTFAPPLVFVLTYQRGFIVALEYAAAVIAVLLILLPTLMAWRLKTQKLYQTVCGRLVLIVTAIFAFFVLIIDLCNQYGYFAPLISRYVNL